MFATQFNGLIRFFSHKSQDEEIQIIFLYSLIDISKKKSICIMKIFHLLGEVERNCIIIFPIYGNVHKTLYFISTSLSLTFFHNLIYLNWFQFMLFFMNYVVLERYRARATRNCLSIYNKFTVDGEVEREIFRLGRHTLVEWKNNGHKKHLFFSLLISNKKAMKKKK